MAKRPIMEVDEEYLKEVMAGGIVRQRKDETAATPAKQPEPAPKEEKPAQEETAETVIKSEPFESKEPAQPLSRKKREKQDYETLFLQRKASIQRRQTYISSTFYEKLSSFLPVIAAGLGIPAYLDNILAHHLEVYKDEINELYERKIQKPL
jgi:hypothetical protein